MSIIKTIGVWHNAAIERIWKFAVTPHEEKKLFDWLPRTDGFWNKLIHALDDRLTAFKNIINAIVLKTVLVLLAISVVGYWAAMLYRLL